jgi:hypothetical protein
MVDPPGITGPRACKARKRPIGFGGQINVHRVRFFFKLAAMVDLLGKTKKNVVHTARRCYRLGFAITGSEDGVERLLYGGRNPRPKSKLSHGLEEAEVVTR